MADETVIVPEELITSEEVVLEPVLPVGEMLTPTVEEYVPSFDEPTSVFVEGVVAPVIEDTIEAVEAVVVPNLDIASIPLEVTPVEEPTIVKYTEYELDAILALTQASGYSYSEDEGLVLINPKEDFPTKEVIMEAVEAKQNEVRKQNLYSNLSSMCTILTYTVKQWLSYKYVTADQQERYEIKAKAAKEGNIEYFVDEAALLEMDPEVLMAAVLEMSGQWQKAVELSAIKIDAIRVYIKLQIENDIDYAEYAIEYFKSNLSNLDLQTPILETVNKLKSDYEQSKINI